MRINFDKAQAALRGGDRLMVTHADPTKEADRTRYNLCDCGHSITATTYKRLKDDLEPIPDGLFGSEISQTYVLRSERIQ